MEWRNREADERSDESEDYDSEPEDTSRYRLHWSTPRVPDFKKVLDAKRFEEREEAEAAREMEAKEAWKALNGGEGGDEQAGKGDGKEAAKEGEADVEQLVDAEAVRNILATFDLKVNLSEIGLEGTKDASGKDVISFQKFRQFTSLTPRERDEDMTVGRTVGGTLQMHPGSPVKGATPLR